MVVYANWLEAQDKWLFMLMQILNLFSSVFVNLIQ